MSDYKDTVVFGIDLGSTYTRAAYYELDTGKCKILPALPSYVGFDEQNQKYISGEEAKRLYYEGKTNIYYNLKKSVLDDALYNDDLHLKSTSLISELIDRLVNEFLNTKDKIIKGIVVTVPSYFSERHRLAICDAVELAGLNVLRVISEPAAAMLHYSRNYPEYNCGTFLLIDSGGLTTDACLCKVKPGIISVIGNYGDNRCGGFLIDQYILKHLVDTHSSHDHKLEEIAENIKINFNSAHDVNYTFNNQNYFFAANIIRQAYQTYIERLVKVYANSIKTDNVEKVLLIGGPFNSQYLVNTLKKQLDSNKKEVSIAFDSGYSAARGAARHAADLLKNNSDTTVISETTPMTIGIEIDQGVFAPIIPAGAKIPCKYTHMFTTTEDNQKNVVLKLYQGEHNVLTTNQCTYLGSVSIDLDNAPRGIPILQVTLSINVNGILSIHVKDDCGNVKEFVVSASNRLKKQEKDYISQYLSKFRHSKNIIYVQINELLDKIKAKPVISTPMGVILSKNVEDIENMLKTHYSQADLITNYNVLLRNYLNYLNENLPKITYASSL